MTDKFFIACLECGSKNVYIKEEINYDIEEMPYVEGYYLECQDCGNNSL